MGIPGCTDLVPSHPLCFSRLPKRDPYEPAQYQKDLMAKKWDFSALGRTHGCSLATAAFKGYKLQPTKENSPEGHHKEKDGRSSLDLAKLEVNCTDAKCDSNT